MSDGDGRRVDFIGIGAKKAATTWIAKCLSEHPDIYMSSCKELHFFSDDQKYEKGATHYLGHFVDRKEHQIAGEFSTSYLHHPPAAERIKRMFPDVKIIVSLRHPAYRALSHAQHLKSKGHVGENEPIEAIVEKWPGVLRVGKYSQHLKRFVDLFGEHAIHVVFFEDIKERPEETMASLYAFLGVDPEFNPARVKYAYNTAISRKGKIHTLRTSLFLFLRRSVLGRFLIRLVRKLNIASSRTKASASSSQFTKREFRALCDYYEEEIKNIGELLGCETRVWESYGKR